MTLALRCPETSQKLGDLRRGLRGRTHQAAAKRPREGVPGAGCQCFAKAESFQALLRQELVERSANVQEFRRTQHRKMTALPDCLRLAFDFPFVSSCSSKQVQTLARESSKAQKELARKAGEQHWQASLMTQSDCHGPWLPPPSSGSAGEEVQLAGESGVLKSYQVCRGGSDLSA